MAHSTATMEAPGYGALALPGLPTPQAEARAFWLMRGRLLRCAVRQTLAASRLRLTLIAVLSGLLWLALFWLCADGFQFLRMGVSHAPTHDQIVHHVFGTFYLALMAMLMVSCGIILYGALFRGRDVPLLLTIPASTERVFLHKFQEAVLLSSWAFVLLGSPMFVAYGVTAGSPWYYYVLLPPFLIAFTYIPAAVGAMVCMGIVRWLPGGRALFLLLVVAVLAVAGLWIGRAMATGYRSDLLTPAWFQEVLQRLRFSQQRLLPSWWLSMGILEAARSDWTPGAPGERPPWAESLLFLALTAANALFFRQAAALTARWLYRPAYSRLHGRRAGEGRLGWPRVDALLDEFRRLVAALDRAVLALPVVSCQTRLLLVKDLRLFRRDPVQWSQFIVFFLLLLLYFVSIVPFTYDVHHAAWVNMVSFLNLSVVGLLLSTFTTRFIFPMISLEGRRFWIMGLLPVRRERILWGKFLYAVGGSVVPCSLLVFVSDWKLAVAPMVLASHQLTCVLLALGLSGISVGLGAMMPSLREQSPARIAAGFGGTLCLVLSAIYIVLIVALTALPCHFQLASQEGQAAMVLSGRPALQWWLRFWLVAGTGASVLLGLAATVLPLWGGFRAFRKMEF